MKKIILSIILIVCVFLAAKSQDEGIYRHYIFNHALVNPAYSGFEDEHMLIFNYNSHWADFPGRPQTVTASWNGPVSARIGLGALISSDKAASFNTTRARLSYAFKFILNEVDLSLGLATEYQQIKLDGTALLNPLLETNDLAIIDATEGLGVFDAAIGVHGRVSEDLFFGLALPNLVRARVDSDPNIDTKSETGLEYFLAYVGYKWQVEEYNFNLEPSIMVKNLRNSDFHVDFNLKGNFFEDQLVGGVTYSLGAGNRVALLMGTELTNFAIYYSYTTSFQTFQQYNNGTHEVSLAFTFGARKKSIEDE